MKKLRITALLLLIAMCAGAVFGCVENPPLQTEEASVTGGAGGVTTEPLPIDTKPADTQADTGTADTEPVQSDPEPGEPGYVIPEENLTGKNSKSDPAEDDGDGPAILQRLIKESIIKNPDAKPDSVVPRIDFAYDVDNCTGFLAQQGAYICENVYTDMEKYSAEMRRAEIAVNQGFMNKVEGTEFKPNDPITYGEVLRGMLYAVGYRKYADKYGVAKLASETGLSDYIDLSKPNSSTVTYAEYAQILLNAVRMTLVQSVIKDGQIYTVSRGDTHNLKSAYISNNASEADSLFRVANYGWEIYTGGGYRYGPSMIINEDGTIDCWLASNSGVSGEVDWGKYRKSYDGGHSWTTDTGAVRPTSSSEDWNWSCDPGVIKIGEYYYATYTTTVWHDGLDNNLFVSRSKTPQGAFVEKWNGENWSYGDPKAIVTFDGQKAKWGCGEGSMVVVGDTLYLYASWNDTLGEYTRVYTAPANDPNWPGKLTFRGSAYKHNASEDSADVKYVDAYECFVSVATASRFSENCYVHVMTSFDGLYFRQEAQLKHKTKGSNIRESIHNMGITGDPLGHIDIFNVQHFIAYAYQPTGFDWANWPTRMSPITWVGTDLYGHEDQVENNGDKPSTTDKKNTPKYIQMRITNSNLPGRTINITKKGGSKTFSVCLMNNKGADNVTKAADILSSIEYFYDETKLKLDKSTRTVTLLCDELVRVYAKYGDLMCEFAVSPDYLDQSKPIAFYPEVDTVTFYYRNETKQPGFIAKSATNEYLVLWGFKSSFTDANTKDIPSELQKWDQKATIRDDYDKNVISVSADGQITAKGVGETVVTVDYMGFTASVRVVVEKLR